MCSIDATGADEVGVVEAERQRRAHARQQPEADDDRRLGPSAELEVVVDRRHPEDAALEDPEAADLQDDRQRLGDVEGADDRQQELHVEGRSEEHTSELQSLMRSSYAVFCLKKKTDTP